MSQSWMVMCGRISEQVPHSGSARAGQGWIDQSAISHLLYTCAGSLKPFFINRRDPLRKPPRQPLETPAGVPTMTHRHHSIGLFALLLAIAVPALAQTSTLTYPELSQARRTTIARMLPERPAGFGVPCANRVAWKPAAQYFQSSIERAETLIAAPLPPWEDAAYLRYSRDGDRNEGQAMLGRHTGQLAPLVLAECSEWKRRFLPRIAQQLDAISAEPSWTLPAHDPQLLNFHGAHYYVELNAATLGHSVAEALYLLGDKIPLATRKRAMAALELHVFGPMRRAYAGQEKSHFEWLTAEHNWNAVCHNGVTDAALTILPSRADRALFAAAAERWAPNYLNSFSASGYDNEGIGYWVYGFSNYDELREHLWYSTRGKVDLYNNPHARKAALFGFQFAMLPGVYADFGDAKFGYQPEKSFLAVIDRTFGLGVYPDDLDLMRGDSAPTLPAAVYAAFPNKSQRHDPDTTAAELKGPRAWYPENGILVDRSAPNGDLAITIKAGGNGNHSHNDVGSYSIGLKSTQIVGDPGGPTYYIADTFSPKRYTYRLLNSFGHPVPELDGKLQLEATTVHPTVLAARFTDQQDTIVMDITAAYNDPNIKKLVRTMQFPRASGAIDITDDFDTAATADIVESFPTHGAMKKIDAKTFQIDFNDAHIQISIDAPGGFTLIETKVDDMGNPFTRIGAKIHLATSGKVTMHFSRVGAK
jgi:hypothetical protein